MILELICINRTHEVRVLYRVLCRLCFSPHAVRGECSPFPRRSWGRQGLGRQSLESLGVRKKLAENIEKTVEMHCRLAPWKQLKILANLEPYSMRSSTKNMYFAQQFFGHFGFKTLGRVIKLIHLRSTIRGRSICGMLFHLGLRWAPWLTQGEESHPFHSDQMTASQKGCSVVQK